MLLSSNYSSHSLGHCLSCQSPDRCGMWWEPLHYRNARLYLHNERLMPLHIIHSIAIHTHISKYCNVLYMYMTSQVDVVFCIELWYSTESWIGIRQHGIYRYILWSICIHLSTLAQLVWSKLKDNQQKLCWPSSWCWFWSIWTSKNPDVLLANIWKPHMLELKSPSLLPLRIT